MSARSELYAALMHGGPHSPDRSEKASMLIDAYAHELAEKIRAGWDETRGATQASKVMAFAADLIDPEVSNNGG